MIYNSAVRGVLILLASTGCSQIFGIDSPVALDAASNGAIDAPSDTAVPPSDALVTVTFEEGTNGYTGTEDTYIDSGSPDLAKDMDQLVRIRDNQRWGLLDFTSVFGTTANRVPPSATIVSATLKIQIQSTNCTGMIADVTTPWTNAVTYNTFGPTPGVQSTEDYSTTVAAIPTQPGLASIDVANSFRTWQMGTNNGWIFLATVGSGGGDCTFRSSDDGILMQHPKLIVTYAP